jgi:hypothetical protein
MRRNAIYFTEHSLHDGELDTAWAYGNYGHCFTRCVFTIYSLPAFVVLISREIVRQRRWSRLATEDAWVDKLTDYLRSCTTEKQYPLSLTAVIICLAMVNYQKIIHHRKFRRPMQVNVAFNSIEESRVINNDSHIHYSIFYVTPTIRRLLPILSY